MKSEPSRNLLSPEGATGDSGEVRDSSIRLSREALRASAAGRLYRRTLIGRVPADLRLGLRERWPGDAERGAAILAGEVEFSGELIRNPTPVWFPPGAGDGWLAAWHGFAWLADVISVGAAGRVAARGIVQSWLADNTAWHPIAWRSDVAASRIFAWIAHFDEIAPRDSDEALRHKMLTSLSSQLRHLARTASWEVAGAGRLRALKGLVGGLVALGPSERRLGRALKALERELAVQVLPDGGHRSRSPSQQLWVLRDLIDLRGVLRAANLAVPEALQGAIEQMAPMLRFFRHGDGRLALFNGSIEEDGVLIDLVLTRSESESRAPMQAPESGFHRLVAERALVLVDTGAPPPPGFDDHAHAGTLSFEFSHERERVIVNCGGYRGAKANWRRVARASAAHSVLVAADTNSTEIREDGTLGRVPGSVNAERAEDDGRQWIAASHDGYRERFGLLYSRELYLAAEGDDLRGEEKLAGRSGTPFAVRFHLHPAVEVRLLEGGAGARLKLASGTVWRLRAAGAQMSLDESVYLGSGEPCKTQQIVLTGTTKSSGALVSWTMIRQNNILGKEAVSSLRTAANRKETNVSTSNVTGTLSTHIVKTLAANVETDNYVKVSTVTRVTSGLTAMIASYAWVLGEITGVRIIHPLFALIIIIVAVSCYGMGWVLSREEDTNGDHNKHLP